MAVDVRELFADVHVEGETYPIAHDEIDLGPLVRDALALGLPLAPLCREDCGGPHPEAYPVREGGVDGDDEVGEPPRDPRWAALDILRERPADSDPGDGVG